MKPGHKFFRQAAGVAAFVCCSLSGFTKSDDYALINYGSARNVGVVARTLGIFTVLSVLNPGCDALPPSSFFKRLGSPMPEIGGPSRNAEEEEDSEEEDDPLESSPRVEPQITPMNRDQCLAKLLCGMSVPVTGGGSKKNYYNEYANIVSRFFEAFPLDDELQSKESIETYDDYSTEDDSKPSRKNSKRKPMNSSRVEATQPTLQLFDLALVDVAKPEDLENRTKQTIQKVDVDGLDDISLAPIPIGNRIARARRIVENLGQKLQTVRQCQSIAGCPFTFKQLREKLKKKEAQRISSNVPLPTLPGPLFLGNSKRKPEPTQGPFSFPSRHQSQPNPIPPTSKPESLELFSNEQSSPYKATDKGDDELEEIFGPPKISQRPLGFHSGVDDSYHYDYNPNKPWRPGSEEGTSYDYPPIWKNNRNRPRPFGPGGNHNGPPPPPGYGNGDGQQGPGNQRPPPPNHRPRPRPNNPNINYNGPPPRGSPEHQKRYPPPPQKPKKSSRPQEQPEKKKQPQQQQQQQQQQQAPQKRKPTILSTAPPRPAAPTSKSPFPKKKISYLSSPYKKPVSNEDDDEGAEDINKVAPVELIGNLDAGENEPTKTTTTPKPLEVEGPTEESTKKKKKKNDDDDDSDEYEDDDNYEDDDEDDDLDEYSEEEDDKKKTKKSKVTKKKKKEEEEEDEDEEEEEDEPETATQATTTTTKGTTTKTTTTLKPKKNLNLNPNFDDETDDVDQIWMKLHFATSGGQQDLRDKTKSSSEENTKAGEKKGGSVDESEGDEDDENDDDEDDDEDEEDEEETNNYNNNNEGTAQKTRTGSSSGSVEDDVDDEAEEASQLKYKTRRKPTVPKKKKKPTTEKSEDEMQSDVDQGPQPKKPEEKGGKNKSKKKKNQNKGSSEEDDSEAERRKHIMLEIGGRPLVPKPENEKTNAQKTSNLITNRFKFQFINPYAPAAQPSSHQSIDSQSPNSYGHHGPPPYHHSSFAPTTSAPSLGSGGGSSLPFKLKINPGALGSLSGGGSTIPLGSLPGFGGGQGEIPDPHHPPPPTPFMPMGPGHHHHHSQLRQESMQSQSISSSSSGSSSGLGSLGGSALSGASSLFKINAFSTLKNIFKRPSSGFDPMNHHDGHAPPPPSAFMHRPIGPESSNYRRDNTPPSGGGGSGSSTKVSKGGKSKGKVKKNKLFK